jgi:hypothetical protein
MNAALKAEAQAPEEAGPEPATEAGPEPFWAAFMISRFRDLPDDEHAWTSAYVKAGAPEGVLLSRSRHKLEQIDQALQFLWERGSSPDNLRRAGVILLASRNASHLERTLGARAAGEADGQEVKCRACRHTWTVEPWNPYFNATRRKDGTWARGLCAPCIVLAESRPDSSIKVLEGVVHPPAGKES